MLELLKSKPGLTRQHLQIIACAGSGKTEFVSLRIAYLIAEGLAKPENIVAFTFTERAAQELKFRIRSKIRQLIGHQPDIGDLYVGTIHSFCYELLKEFVPGYRAFDVLDEGKRFAFINAHRGDLNYKQLKAWLESNGFHPSFGMRPLTWVLNTFIRGVDITREEMLPPEKISQCGDFIDAFHTYEEKLQEHRFLDFSSMMALAVQNLAKNRTLLAEARKRFTHITVDEYQDINPIQERLIRLLTGPETNLCVVGDDDQAIYQWRGSMVENILTFTKRYKNVYTHYLPINFRSTNSIVHSGAKLIQKNKNRLNKKMGDSGKKAEQGDIYKVSFPTQAEEANFIVEKIQHLLGAQWNENNGRQRGLAYSDIAIFFRSVKYDGQPYLEALEEAGIPYAVSGIGGLFEAGEVDVIFSIFSYLGSFKKHWDSKAGSGETPEPDEIYEQAAEIFHLPTKRQFVKELQILKDNLQKQRRLQLQGLYGVILNLLGVDDEEYHAEDHEIEMYNLGRMSQAISDYEGTRSYCTFNDIERFCWFIRHYAEGAYDAGAGEDPTRMINAVQVMTLHGAKGLGFPVVFMPYCIERISRHTPPGFLDSDAFNFARYSGSTEDERRLFYVGLTRAKKFLFVTTSRQPMYKVREKKPLQFFTELADEHAVTISSPDPTKRKRLPPEPSVEDYHFPTSYSELSDYIRCEYDYKMRYIYGFNPVIVQALGYGNQVHNLLNMLHKIAQQTGQVPLEEEAAAILEAHFSLRYAAREQEETLKRSALRSILRYMNLWREDFSLSVKTERPFEMDLENALLTGTIDLLKRENGRSDILEIIDFKTGNDRKDREALDLQVQLYTLAANEALALNVQKAHVHFLDEHKQPRIEVLTTPKQLDLAMRTLSDAVRGITTRRFKRNPRNSKTCGTCDWEKICPKKKKQDNPITSATDND